MQGREEKPPLINSVTLDKTLIVLGLSYLIENRKIAKSYLTRVVVRLI